MGIIKLGGSIPFFLKKKIVFNIFLKRYPTHFVMLPKFEDCYLINCREINRFSSRFISNSNSNRNKKVNAKPQVGNRAA